MEAYLPALLWIVITAYIVAFFLAFGVGANDVANSFGTSVGSKVLTLRQACILATIFEVLGAGLLGYQVSDTVRKGVFGVKHYEDAEKILMLVYLSSLVGGAIWNLVATFMKLPISGTHSVVGAVLGSHIAVHALDGIDWWTLGKIVLSWFVSPLLSGTVSVCLFFVIKKTILNRAKPLEAGLISLPLFYGFTLLINAFSILHDGPSMLYLDRLPWWASLCIAIVIGVVVAIVIWFVVVPRQRRTGTAMMNSPTTPTKARTDDGIDTVDNPLGNGNNKNPLETTIKETNGDVDKPLPYGTDIETNVQEKENGDVPKTTKDDGVDQLQDKPEIAYIFRYLQILTACFGSFAHGANDVSNAIGPLIGVVIVWQYGKAAQTEPAPIYLMLYGGVGITIGLWVWGRRVIKTMGEDLTAIAPSSGFTIEIASAATVLIASKIGLPVSTTHCKVGSVVMVGRFRGTKDSVDWSLFRNIFLAWILTVPITAVISAVTMLIFRAAAIRAEDY